MSDPEFQPCGHAATMTSRGLRRSSTVTPKPQRYIKQWASNYFTTHKKTFNPSKKIQVADRLHRSPPGPLLSAVLRPWPRPLIDFSYFARISLLGLCVPALSKNPFDVLETRASVRAHHLPRPANWRLLGRRAAIETAVQVCRATGKQNLSIRVLTSRCLAWMVGADGLVQDDL